MRWAAFVLAGIAAFDVVWFYRGVHLTFEQTFGASHHLWLGCLATVATITAYLFLRLVDWSLRR